MVQHCQTSGVIKSDSRSHSVVFGRLIRYLIVPSENLFHLVLRNVRAGIDDGNLYVFVPLRDFFSEGLHKFISIDNIEADLDFAAGRREFQGIGHEVSYDLVQFVLVKPCYERVFDSARLKCDVLVRHIVAENIQILGNDGDGVGKADLESERILLQFVEVHQLVHQFQHPVHTSAYNHQKIPVGTLYVRRFGQLRYRSGNQGERCPEFM